MEVEVEVGVGMGTGEYVSVWVHFLKPWSVHVMVASMIVASGPRCEPHASASGYCVENVPGFLPLYLTRLLVVCAARRLLGHMI